MKFTCKVVINRPLAEVVALWQDENHFKEWQSGFQRIEHISGTPGTAGAQSKIFLDDGRHKMELLQTVQTANLPDEHKVLVEHKHMDNIQVTRFKALGPNQTEYSSEIDYFKMKAFIPKLMAFLMPGVFRKQVQKWLDQFKAFAERT